MKNRTVAIILGAAIVTVCAGSMSILRLSAVSEHASRSPTSRVKMEDQIVANVTALEKPPESVEAARRLREANFWRVEAVELGREAAKRGDFAEAERLYLHAGVEYCRGDLGDLYIEQRRWSEAIETIAPRLDRGEDPKWVNPALAVCFYGLGDRRRGDALAPKYIVRCGAQATANDTDGKALGDETPNHVPIDTSRRMEATAWHTIGVDRNGGRFSLHCARKAALLAPECPAFTYSFGWLQESNGYHSGALRWYRLTLPIARGMLVEDIRDSHIPQTETAVRDHQERPDKYPDRGEYTE